MPNRTPSPCRASRLPRPRVAVPGLGALVLGLASTLAQAQTVSCHLAYAGFERTITVAGVTQAGEVPPQIEGASFVFHVLNKTAPFEEAAVTISTYTPVDGQNRLLHQATYVPTGAQHTAPNTTHGFTGLQVVQEPRQGREWRYWCQRGSPKPVVAHPAP